MLVEGLMGGVGGSQSLVMLMIFQYPEHLIGATDVAADVTLVVL